MVTEITIVPAEKSKKGYLKRRKEGMKINRRLQENDETAIDDMVAFVLKYATVTGPEGADLHDAIMEMSQEEFEAVFNPSDSVKPTKGG